jgi:hypothetical protein
MDRVEIRNLVVVHVRPCEDCNDGRAVTCRHGGNCDCPGYETDCPECDGTGELVDDACACERCVLLFTRLEEIRHVQQH